MKFQTNLARCLVTASLMVPPVALAQQSNLMPIITYDQEHPLVGMVNVLPMVQVFSSGEVVVFRGSAMKNPGRIVLNLSVADLAEITSLAETAGVPQFDESELLQANDGGTVLSVSSDPTTSTFEFNRVSGQNVLSAGDGTTTDSMQTVVMDDVLFTAAALPNSASVNSLKELHIRLIQLYTQAGQ